MCEIKPAAVSVCNTRTTGWGFSIHPRIATGVEKGFRNAVPDGGLWEARGDGAGRRDGGGFFGANSALWPVAPLHPHAGDGPGAPSEVAINFCIFVYFTHPV